MFRSPAWIALLPSIALVACTTSIGTINKHPKRHYQNTVTIVGQVTRMQTVGGDTLIEVADSAEKRILVRAASAGDLKTTDWVKVKGIFVPELRVGNQTVYDAISAESVEETSAPRLRNLF